MKNSTKFLIGLSMLVFVALVTSIALKALGINGPIGVSIAFVIGMIAGPFIYFSLSSQ